MIRVIRFIMVTVCVTCICVGNIEEGIELIEQTGSSRMGGSSERSIKGASCWGYLTTGLGMGIFLIVIILMMVSVAGSETRNKYIKSPYLPDNRFKFKEWVNKTRSWFS